jgi:tetratricopeptide (TPR) repeat protein
MGWVEKLNEVDEKKAKGQSLLAAGAFEEAKAALEHAKAILDGYYQEQNGALMNSLQESRSRIVEKNMALGDSHWSEGNLEAARECYRISLDLAQSARERDEVLIKLGQIDQKEAPRENLERLAGKVAEDPESAEALYDFATELAMEGFYPEAIRSLERLVQITPDDADVYYRLGNAFLDTQRLEEAQQAYGRALELKFEDPAEIYFRMACAELLGRARHVEAKKQLRKALELRADHVESLHKLAHLEALEENYARAIDHLKGVVALDAEDADAWNELADLHQTTGQKGQAMECWKKALDLDPEGDAGEYARDKLASAEEESLEESDA